MKRNGLSHRAWRRKMARAALRMVAGWYSATFAPTNGPMGASAAAYRARVTAQHEAWERAHGYPA